MNINLLSSPRNRSTLLMYSFAQRSDMQVIDEPMYAYYLKRSGADHPGREQILESQNTNLSKLTAILKKESDKTIFIKNMAHHYFADDFDCLIGLKNILYIRNPRAIIRSYSKVIANPTAADVGIKKVRSMFDFLERHKQRPIVLDSDKLIANPPRILKSLCNHLNILYMDEMLHWESGPKEYDGVWAPHWYSQVHNSTGFRQNPNAATEAIHLASHLESVAEDCLPDYNYLSQYSIN